ncbi:helicase-associated domain-containing protein [Jidongwangia harbinensis]|uniref:helicase-associated domain-containing protein n=1 Tax=Jidongwangia harbinensis TaxID=2878561 RepID=UPI001CDA2C22|nr:helicase-associated domain-containing protein [Jidongwangia harbinensis]MCA2214522.1 helicase C-terminal domain-containing protein [Jidongwangia harbinensis]
MTTSFADQLRALSDEALGALIRVRPDLVVPVPSDLSALAVRAQSRGSVARCLDALDEFTLQVLDAARLTRSAETALTSVDAILALAADGPADEVRSAVDRLRDRFLLAGAPDALQVVGAVDEVTSPYPAGLGRPADFLDPRAAALCADRAKLRRTVLSAPPGARAVLDRLAAGPPVGALNGTAAMAEPVRWLVDNHILVPISDAGRAPRPDGELVELPREVGMLLRRDTGPLGPLRPAPPTPDGPARDPKAVDSAGAGQAMEAVRTTEVLLEALAAEPAPVLKTGGLGVRDLKRLARASGVDESSAALFLEVAYAAGLLGEAEAGGSARAVTVSRASGGLDEIFLPTGAYDLWRALSVARRWHALAVAWLAMTRQPGLVGQRDERDRPINALSPEAERGGAPQARREALHALAGLPAGTAPPVTAVLELLSWQAPRRARGREAAHRDALAGAATLGATALNALTSYARLLTADRSEAEADPLGAETSETSDAIRALDSLLPAPVDHVLVQADLSVVVPGPPEPELAAELEVVAEPESAGGASVHRVTTASVRRALDVGYSAGDLHALFRRRSRTPVPQALTYLIDDAARKHGGLRAGSAGGYLRSDDEALLAEVMADKRLSVLALRRLAPTVLVSPYQVSRLLGALRDAGFAPVAEDAGGAAVLSRPKVRRAPSRTPVSARVDHSGPPMLAGPRLAGVVEQIRRGDVATRAARRAPITVRAANGQPGPGLTAVQAHGQAMAVLQQAVREKARVWVGYVDSHGSTLSRLVRPVSLSAGFLRAEDERTETLHTFALHRITAAVPEE